jgi:hypothetical protein
LLRTCRRYAKKHGYDVHDVLLSIIYGKDMAGNTIEVATADRIEAIRVLYEFTMPRITEGGEVDRLLGSDPSLVEDRPNLMPIDGGKDDGAS